ncbi:MAG: hypothetical protein LBO00_05510 [Zoogloeaceae bacterium]|jgi:hypothetical protein|nr:hypothetical protein [Zoogloeaceae bacterium]
MNLAADLPQQNEARMPEIVFIMDFDGVINYSGTTGYYQEKNDFGALMQERLRAGDICYEVFYSNEMLRKLKAFQRAVRAKWLWLTTWQNHTEVLDQALCLRSNETLVNDGSDAGKLACLLDFVRTHPDVAFVWIDDTAAPLFDEARFTLGNPHLVIAPDGKIGLNRNNLKTLKAFLETLRGRAIPVEL